jgi:ubiquinone/menaquinone biosynthesis C-methylase UbiE
LKGTALTTRQAWDAGIDRELDWWGRYLDGRGLSFPEEFTFRFDPDSQLQEDIARYLPARSDDGTYRMLDCGAGPATTLGKWHQQQRIGLVAVDALAERYDELLATRGLKAPVSSQPGEIEHLDRLFAPASFDLVYMRLALDHCYDPAEALRQMARVAKPGGIVLVEHYRDPGETTFKGLRQWNLHPSADDLVIENPTCSYSVRELFPSNRLDVTFSPTWLTMAIHI